MVIGATSFALVQMDELTATPGLRAVSRRNEIELQSWRGLFCSARQDSRNEHQKSVNACEVLVAVTKRHLICASGMIRVES